MSFKEFMEDNKTSMVKQYVQDVFEKPTATLDDLYITLGDALKEDTNLGSAELSEFTQKRKAIAKRDNTVLKDAMTALEAKSDEYMTAQEVATAIGHDNANYVRTTLLKESSRKDTDILVTHPKTDAPGRPNPNFRFVKIPEVGAGGG